MLKAKLDSIRKNKKGFSLVELIIVIAIMVALIAVMAPNFVKYVQKSRDTALQTAAEDLYSAVKVFYGDPECKYEVPEDGQIDIYVSDAGVLTLASNLTTGDQMKDIVAASGAEIGKKMGNTDKVGQITITNSTTTGPSFKMEIKDTDRDLTAYSAG
jgi:prepilin-type N-terminal cleavage/methylation domain-containing protein